jgi:hypothetical protein
VQGDHRTGIVAARWGRTRPAAPPARLVGQIEERGFPGRGASWHVNPSRRSGAPAHHRRPRRSGQPHILHDHAPAGCGAGAATSGGARPAAAPGVPAAGRGRPTPAPRVRRRGCGRAGRRGEAPAAPASPRPRQAPARPGWRRPAAEGRSVPLVRAAHRAANEAAVVTRRRGGDRAAGEPAVSRPARRSLLEYLRRRRP